MPRPLSRNEHRLIHVIEAGTEQEFLEFKTSMLDMPSHLATHPWFHKDNAYKWMFVRDAYRAFAASQLAQTSMGTYTIASGPAATQSTQSQAGTWASTQSHSSQPFASMSTHVSDDKRKRPEEGKPKRASKKMRSGSEIIDITSSESANEESEEEGDEAAGTSASTSSAKEDGKKPLA